MEKPKIVLCLAHVVVQYWNVILRPSDGFFLSINDLWPDLTFLVLFRLVHRGTGSWTLGPVCGFECTDSLGAWPWASHVISLQSRSW